MNFMVRGERHIQKFNSGSTFISKREMLRETYILSTDINFSITS